MYPNTYVCRGIARYATDDYDEAIKDYDRAIRLDPTYAPGRGAKAWLLATCTVEKYRDGKKAVEAAKKALELSGGKRSGECYETLAAAYAEARQFDEALRWQRKALDDERYAKAIDEKARTRLKLYEQNKPCRGRYSDEAE